MTEATCEQRSVQSVHAEMAFATLLYRAHRSN